MDFHCYLLIFLFYLGYEKIIKRNIERIYIRTI